jgi:hypothetical protein
MDKFDQFDLDILSALIREVNAADEENCNVRISNLIAQLAKLARQHWLQEGKGDLWHESRAIWQDVRRQLEQNERRKNPEKAATEMWLRSKEEGDFKDLAFLAEIATFGNSLRLKYQAKTELLRLIETAKIRNAPVYKAVKLISDMIGASERSVLVERESISAWEISDVSVDHDLPTLTTRRSEFRLDPKGLLQVQVSFTDPPELQEILTQLERGDQDSVLRILEIFDSTESPRVKNACVEALRLIGGCFVAQQLSARIASNQLYIQCLVLCALDGLASQPYRGPAEEYGEPLSHQLETINLVLNRLHELKPSSADIRAICESAIEGVTKHKLTFKSK